MPPAESMAGKHLPALTTVRCGTSSTKCFGQPGSLAHVLPLPFSLKNFIRLFHRRGDQYFIQAPVLLYPNISVFPKPVIIWQHKLFWFVRYSDRILPICRKNSYYLLGNSSCYLCPLVILSIVGLHGVQVRMAIIAANSI